MELIGASWIIFIKYTSYILSKLEKFKHLENLPVFLKILLVGYCIHINSVKIANEIVPYLIFYSTPWFEQCVTTTYEMAKMPLFIQHLFIAWNVKKDKMLKLYLISEAARDLARKLPLPIVCGYNRNENIEKLLPSCL